MSENKKIRGAQEVEVNNIRFKSIVESKAYQLFLESDLEFEYEPTKFILWTGKKLERVTVLAPKKIRRGKYGRELINNSPESLRRVLDISYTPDFIVWWKNYIIYIDVKGMENDVYPLKKKMFLKYLDNIEDEFTRIFAEPHSIKQVKDLITHIKSL